MTPFYMSVPGFFIDHAVRSFHVTMIFVAVLFAAGFLLSLIHILAYFDSQPTVFIHRTAACFMASLGVIVESRLGYEYLAMILVIAVYIALLCSFRYDIKERKIRRYILIPVLVFIICMGYTCIRDYMRTSDTYPVQDVYEAYAGQMCDWKRRDIV